MFQEMATPRNNRVSTKKQSDDGFKLMNILFDSISTPMLFMDETGEVLAVNSSLTRKLGWRKRDLLGHNIRQLIHEQFHGAFFQLQNSLRRDEQSWQQDLGVIDSARQKYEARFRVQRVQLDGKHIFSMSIQAKSDPTSPIQDPLLKVDKDLLKLTPTEMEVCQYIQDGLTSKEIAEKLYSSFETIQTHRKNIRKKMGLKGSKTPLCTYLRVNKRLPGSYYYQ
ncbi:MAG: LuxR C-terminal-related transcriptional regulator [Desulfohalobiaceae bacterium]|nr:LuxR C-terminal-related transcriptional regulator [Desulfohalobiaceae bacterium]